jgi:signal transduction histidine kinase
MGARGRIWARHPLQCAGAAVLALAIVVFAAVVSVDAARWWGRTFPGFLVLPNRLVPVTSLPGWRTEDAEGLFLAEVVAVDGRAVTTSAEVYAEAARRPPGTAIDYTFRRDGRTWTRRIDSLAFSGSDVVLLFGVYILNGVVFGLIGVAVWVLRPDAPAVRGMLAFGLTTAAFMLSAAGLYGPATHVFRIHMAAEAFFPAALAHLALVFPPVEGPPRHRRAIALGWAGSAALAVASQLALLDLPRSLALGNLSYLYIGVVSLVFFARMAAVYRHGTVLERTKIRVVLLAALPGVVFPAVLVAISGATGGALPVNAAAFTTFLFPLGLAYATVRRDLFEIDAVVRHLVHYTVLTGLTTLLCLGVLALTTGVLRETAASPLLPLHFALAVVLLLMPLRDRIQRLVDRICFRPTYNARRVLEDTSAALGSTLDVEVIAATIVARADGALAVEAAALYLVAPEGSFRIAGGQGLAWGETAAVEADAPLVRRLADGEVVTWYADPGVAGGPLWLGALAAEVVVPMLFRGRLVGFLGLGPRRSGKHYSADDVQFLRTLANQTALSVRHAEAYQALHHLTVTLEQKVTERTAELGRANGELHDSLARLREAYRELEHSQEKLVHAEKMATLGRLAAGVAHEVSTPLGAALSSLHLARELVGEYRDAIDDPSVTRADHVEIASELDAVAQRAEQWTERAARFILAVKAHMRGYAAAPTSTFDVATVVRETEVMLQQELQTAGCELRVAVAPGLPPLDGDPTKLGQVLTNLVSNSVDAYEDAGLSGVVEVSVGVDGGTITIAVRDRGCGIAPEHRERVFEEMFTTKPPGRGTGLGLAIVRDLVTNHFGGRIELESVPGEGTTFTLRLPGANGGAEALATRRPAA